ncbi:hypothetical protein EGR_09858 [Echinococcus granulosus]|uniref:Uncharacterized protein n=1 Tax=Echinococcus granulosus TaxID=6210 RepID=W6U2J4_ECHGR|nr:hypothetical protein EGR_09858 [Echinococcus granulosus]EUB55293.1 hypothetical protein EGR_09858 [Echinococcus granulosus]
MGRGISRWSPKAERRAWLINIPKEGSNHLEKDVHLMLDHEGHFSSQIIHISAQTCIHSHRNTQMEAYVDAQKSMIQRSLKFTQIQQFSSKHEIRRRTESCKKILQSTNISVYLRQRLYLSSFVYPSFSSPQGDLNGGGGFNPLRGISQKVMRIRVKCGFTTSYHSLGEKDEMREWYPDDNFYSHLPPGPDLQHYLGISVLLNRLLEFSFISYNLERHQILKSCTYITHFTSLLLENFFKDDFKSFKPDKLHSTIFLFTKTPFHKILLYFLHLKKVAGTHSSVDFIATPLNAVEALFRSLASANNNNIHSFIHSIPHSLTDALIHALLSVVRVYVNHVPGFIFYDDVFLPFEWESQLTKNTSIKTLESECKLS